MPLDKVTKPLWKLNGFKVSFFKTLICFLLENVKLGAIKSAEYNSKWVNKQCLQPMIELFQYC